MKDTVTPATVGIIGGRGQFGAWTTRILESRGIRVIASDLGSEISNQEVVARSDAVIIAVPIGVTARVICEIAPDLRPEQAVLDLTSVKTPFVEALQALPCEVLSLHPMFSPSVGAAKGQRCVVCPVRGGAMGAFFRALLIEEGIELIDMTPEQHDRTMAIVQGVTHFQAIAAAHCLAELGFDPQVSLAAASPVYRIRLAMIGRILAQNPRLYAEIQIFNPYVRDALAAMERSSRALFEAVADRDVDRFVAEFERARRGLRGFERTALEESDRLIAALGSSQR